MKRLDAKTRAMVRALEKEIRVLADQKARVAKGTRGGLQSEKYRKYAKVEELREKIEAKRKRIIELTGKTNQGRLYNAPLPPDRQQGNPWVRILPGGAPGSGKRS